MNKYEAEIFRIGGKDLLDYVKKEFVNTFEIIARTDDMFVLGNKEKNVKFARSGKRVLERHVFNSTVKLSRK
jgi:hypothetical protein